VECEALPPVFDRFLVMMGAGIVLLDLYDILFVYGVGPLVFSLSRPLPFQLNLLSAFGPPDQSGRYILAGTCLSCGMIWRRQPCCVGAGWFARDTIAKLRYTKVRRLLPENCAARCVRRCTAMCRKILEFDDGIVSYENVPAMSASVHARSRGLGCFAAAPSPAIGGQRGFSTVSPTTIEVTKLTTASTSTQAAEWVRPLVDMQRTIMPRY